MTLTYLPHRAPLEAYEAQAAELHSAHAAGAPFALDLVRHLDPRLRDEHVPWLVRPVTDAEVAALPFTLEDARACVVAGYSFADWSALEEWVADVASGGDITAFEDAVEAVIGGQLATLEGLLATNPALVRARSNRLCCFDPPVHRATLLHYVGANGVENHRQRTPPNAVAIATALLDAGADPNALADFYGQPCGTLSLLVSSSHPAEAGLQIELATLLIDRGASPAGNGESWGAPVRVALVFGYPDTAAALAARGSPVVGAADLAGLGHLDDLRVRLPDTDASDLHLALALAAQHGRADCVRVLLDAGVDPDRYNPDNAHPHATPLHHAALGGHAETVAVFIEHGARLDLEDTIYHSTPLGWAEHGQQHAVAELLRA